MIPNLRARLKAVADKPKTEAAPVQCLVLESRVPLDTLGLPQAVTAAQAGWLGLDMPGFDPRRALFLDTETTGLRGAGTVAFLVGLGWLESDAFVVRQLLMRDYPQEADVLAQVADVLARFDCVVSFNGKSFDMPLLRDRFTMARLRERWRDLPQLDLLHAARRTWKLRLGTCTLSALEEAVLGIHREGDLPGSEVPQRFFDYLKCGDMALLDDVLRHNEQDIRSLALLLSVLASAYSAPEAQTSMLDVFSIGRALQRIGEGERARRCFEVASVSEISRQARVELAKSHKHDRDFAAAAEAYQGMINTGEADAAAYVQLAILHERYLGDLHAALRVTERALLRFSGQGFLQGVDSDTLDALQRRRKRLRRRIDRQDESI